MSNKGLRLCLTALLAVAWAAGCSDSNQGRLVLEGPNARIEVRTEPYHLTVRNADGSVVLETLAPAQAGADTGDGYAPFAWTTGEIAWSNSLLGNGQFEFSPQLNPWYERWQLAEASQDATSVTLRYQSDVTDAVVTVRHRLRDDALRVEARVEGVQPRAWAFAFQTPSDEGFLGFGERFTRTDYRGVDVYNWPEEGGVGQGEGTEPGPRNPLPNGEAMAYHPVPFFLSTHGYGFWLDTTWRSSFDLATTFDDAWRVWEIGPETAFEVFVPPTTAVSDWPYAVIDAFTARTGRPMPAPDWMFGARRRIGRFAEVDGQLEIEKMREEDLALTALEDSLHFTPSGNHVGKEEHLRAWVERGHELGIKMLAYYNSLFTDPRVDPGATNIPEVAFEGIENGYFLKNTDGTESVVGLISGSFLNVLQVDVTNPDAVTWFQDKLDWAIEIGYDGWMWDFGEYVQPEVVADNGMTGEELHNLYPVLYDKAVYEHMQQSSLKDDWVVFGRSGYTGSQQYLPSVWSGDPAASFESADGLPSMVRAAINIGVSGVPHWGGDIGGFHCAADGGAAANGELIARWIQQGSMTPVMMDREACSFNNDDVPKATIWSAPEAKESWRIYARLHTRLFPYLFTYSHKATRTGAPIVRHVFLEHPQRRDLRDVDDVHYFGEALFVAPVLARGARERTVQLPPGRFLDWAQQVLYEGDQTVTVPAPITRLPLFLRDGYLVPMLDPAIDTLAPEAATDIVGPSDVDDVYDVVGLLTAAAESAALTLYDGGTLSAQLDGPVDVSALAAAADADALADCDTCALVEQLDGGLQRVRITHGGGTLTAGGLTLNADVDRRVRWDLYVAQ